MTNPYPEYKRTILTTPVEPPYVPTERQRTAAVGEDTRRAWVGLTHEDIDKAIEDNQRFGGFRKVGFAYDLENVLKEKNNGT